MTTHPGPHLLKLLETSSRNGASDARDRIGANLVVRSTLRSAVRSHRVRRQAKELAWEWVGAKWPRLLPPVADRESGQFQRVVPGQELVVSTSGDGSVWTLAVAHSERGGARTWMTRAQVSDAGDADLLDLQTCCSESPNAVPMVAPPSLLGAWVERLELQDAGVAVLSAPREVNNGAQLAGFFEHVLSDQRTIPIIALASRPNSRYYGVDPGGLAQAVRGLAHVVCLAPDVTAAVSDRLGKVFGVVAGAARVYAPGFAATTVAQDHPLIRPVPAHADENCADPGAFRRLLCRRICALSVLEPRPADASR